MSSPELTRYSNKHIFVCRTEALKFLRINSNRDVINALNIFIADYGYLERLMTDPVLPSPNTTAISVEVHFSIPCAASSCTGTVLL